MVLKNYVFNALVNSYAAPAVGSVHYEAFDIKGNFCFSYLINIASTCLRGPTPFEDMIFYLWADSNEICTAYVKLKINHILFMKNFWFSI